MGRDSLLDSSHQEILELSNSTPGLLTWWDLGRLGRDHQGMPRHHPCKCPLWQWKKAKGLKVPTYHLTSV
jgi:hypothetical protein